MTGLFSRKIEDSSNTESFEDMKNKARHDLGSTVSDIKDEVRDLEFDPEPKRETIEHKKFNPFNAPKKTSPATSELPLEDDIEPYLIKSSHKKKENVLNNDQIILAVLECFEIIATQDINTVDYLKGLVSGYRLTNPEMKDVIDKLDKKITVIQEALNYRSQR